MPQPGFTSVAAKGVAGNWGGGHSGGLPWVPDSVSRVCGDPQTTPAPPPSTLRVAGPVTPLTFALPDVEVPIRPGSPH